MVKALTICLLFLPHAVSLSSSSDWVLKIQKNGINIYSRPSDVSKFNDLKIEMDLPGTVSQLSSILMDFEKYPEWAYGTKSAVLIKKINDNEAIYYSEVGAPWPASNRDFYAKVKVYLNADSGSLNVVSTGMKNYLPEKKNLVRIPMSHGTWNISTKPNKIMHLQYILQLDPGGSTPGWILNMFATKGPMETFGNLKKKLEILSR